MAFRLGLRGKIFAISLLLITGVGLASGMYLESQLRQWLEHRIEDELLRHARVGRDLLEHAVPEGLGTDAPRFDELADTLGADTDTRVTIIRADGKVIGDSAIPYDALDDLVDHGNRPEIQAALSSSFGHSRRYSTTVESELLYVAVAFGEPDPVGTVRVSTPLAEVEAAVSRLRVILLLAGVLGLVLAASSSGLASHLLSRRLERLIEQTKVRRSDGDAVPMLSADDDTSAAIGSFNSLARELDRAVERLGAERDRLETILESMQEAVLALDDGHRITLANAAAKQLFVRSRSIEGQALTDVVRVPDLVDLVTSLEKEAKSGEFSLPGPPSRRVLAHVAPLRAQPGCVVVLHDVSETRRLEQVRRDFVANVSHELRTPVSIISANAETLLSGAIDDREHGRNFVDAISRSASRLTSLIRDLLDLSRIEAGRYPLELRTISLEPPVRRAVESLGEQAAQKKIELEFSCETQALARADTAACEQVAVNFVENAVKYTPANGRVRARIVDDGEDVRVEIEDNGPGLAPQHRERVFERFYRVDPGRSREMGGTGLGLSIVKHLVDAMGGQVGFRPGASGGSVFWFTMPRAETDTTQAADRNLEPRLEQRA